ncbi:dicarboxylic amino acid permease [Sarocladium strictum]
MADNELRRDFKPRHVFMFSIACAIGTGLIIGSGGALSKGGPGSLLLAYLAVGAAVFFVMTGLGEMAAYLPMNKGFGGYATRFVDPAFGFATGWNYVFKYFIATPTNLTAAGLVVQYWRPDLNVAIWVTIFGIAVISINLFNVNKLGETEFWLACIKVCTMTAMIMTCLVSALGGAPNKERTGFQYWTDPGAFASYIFPDSAVGRFLGWWACMCQACFAFTGTEVVGMTFGETPNPRKNVPIAVRQTFWRIASFYIIGVLFLGMAVPYNSEELLGATKQKTSAAASPFVIAAKIAGIKVFPDIINACLLVFTLSAATTADIYCASRSLYGLSKDRQAPKIFSKTLKNGSPVWAVALSAAFSVLAYMNATKSSSTVFQYFVSLVTVFAVLNWFAITASHVSFRRALKVQGVALESLPYTGFLQPYGSYYAMFISVIIIVFNGYDAFIPHFKVDTFVLKYLGTVVFTFNVLLWKFLKRTKRVKATEMDLTSGRREHEETESPQDAEWKTSTWKKMCRKLLNRSE